MKTHPAWILALTMAVAIAVGQTAWGQAPYPSANPGFASFSQGSPVIQQASHTSCGACDGGGCGICGQTPTGPPAAPSSCGCSSSCDGGCGTLGGALGGLGNGLGGGIGSYAISPNGQVHGGPGGYDGLHGQENGPFGNGGCCSPIWYDFEISWMSLTRDESSNIGITSDGIDGPIVLSTDDIDGELAHGLRATYAFLFGPSTSMELTYFGAQEWDESASATGAGDLYSVFSNFGLDQFSDPGPPPTIIFGFPQTVDAANLHTLDFTSELHNVELNLRRRWVTAGCLLHGSYLAGARYLSLQEELVHTTAAASGGSMDYNIQTDNESFGFQAGGDLYVCVSPRFKLGLDAKGGIFGNDANVQSVINTIDTGVAATPVNENNSETDVAFVGELSALATFRVTPRLTIKGGYTALYLDNMALAIDNFNTVSPFGATARPAMFENKSEILLHGANFGMTWTW